MNEVQGRILGQVMMYIILLIIILVVLNQFKKGFKSMFSVGEPDKSVVDAQTKEASSIPVDVKKVTKSDSEFNNLANKMFQAMDGIGTSEQSVKDVLNSLKTQDDWNKLIKVFGVRKGENLLAWIRDDFDDSFFMTTTQADLNKILISKGINKNLI